jgi:hypothetical protein
MTATKVVLDRLSVPEREEIDAEVIRIKGTGYEPDVQREYVATRQLTAKNIRSHQYVQVGQQTC